MKNVMFGSLCLLILCKFSVHTFSDAENAPRLTNDRSSQKGSRPSPPPLEAMSDVLWEASLVTFQELLKTDPESARAELQNVSKKLFNGHLLTEEWVPLYFRIRHKGTEHLSDVKRLTELEIRMLTAIAMETGDFQKYALQLQRLQEAYQKYEDREKVQENNNPGHTHGHSHGLPPKTGNASRGTESNAAVDERDIEAVRVEYLSRFKAEFNDHPLTEKMVDTTLALAVKKKPELIELTALQIQIMKEVDAEKYKEEIQNAEAGLRKLQNIRDLLEKQGSLETETVIFKFDINKQLSRLKK